VLVGGGGGGERPQRRLAGIGHVDEPDHGVGQRRQQPGGLLRRSPPVGDQERLAQEGLDERRAGLRRQGAGERAGHVARGDVAEQQQLAGGGGDERPVGRVVGGRGALA